jgi:hypothetical protein
MEPIGVPVDASDAQCSTGYCDGAASATPLAAISEVARCRRSSWGRMGAPHERG